MPDPVISSSLKSSYCILVKSGDRMLAQWIPSILRANAKLQRTLANCSAIRYCQCSSSAGGDNDKPQDNTDKNKSITKSDSSKDKLPEGESSSSVYDPKKDTFFTQEKAFGSKDNKGLGGQERPVFSPEEVETSLESAIVPAAEEVLEAPTNCCMSGCPNCVWIEYVEKLGKKFTDPGMGRNAILKELDKIDDDNIKAFIMMELRVKKLI